MKFRKATPDDHPLMREESDVLGVKIPAVSEGFVSDSAEGPRYWVVSCPYAYGQFRLQVWWERHRGMQYPDILHQL